MQKYVIQTRYFFQWFDYPANHDIVQGSNSPIDAEWATWTPADVCPPVECFLNKGTDDPNPADTSTSTCIANNYHSVDGKMTYDQPVTSFIKENKIAIDTTNNLEFTMNLCVSCKTIDYFDGWEGNLQRDNIWAAPLYSSKVIKVHLIDICVSQWQFTSAHLNYFPVGSGVPASTVEDWKIVVGHLQDTGTPNKVHIDSQLYGSTTLRNFWTQNAWPFTYPPTNDPSYTHGCSFSQCQLFYNNNP